MQERENIAAVGEWKCSTIGLAARRLKELTATPRSVKVLDS